MSRKKPKSPAVTNRQPSAEPITNRMLPPGESVPVAPRPAPVPQHVPTDREREHWSACPKCGVSKLSPATVSTPVCMQTGQRVQTGRNAWAIYKYMRCRMCGKRYQAAQPD